jgi:cell division protease FtsH
MANKIARDMVVEQGMGTKLRNQVFHEDAGGMMFERITHERPYSEETAKEIDSEVASLIKEAARRAEVVISKNRASLNKLSKALLEEETVEEDRVAEILKDAILPKEARLY